MVLLFSLLALSLTAQVTTPQITGSVVNSRGEPAAGASVVFSLHYANDPEPVLARATTDAQGRFVLARPGARPSERSRVILGGSSFVFAYRPGSGLAVVRYHERPDKLLLPDGAPREVTVRHRSGPAPCQGNERRGRQAHVHHTIGKQVE